MRRGKNTLRLMAGGAALAVLGGALAACGGGGTGGGGAKKQITVGYIAWDEDVAVTHLWQKVLAAKGYTVKITQVDAAPLYSGMAKGDIDAFFDSALPTTHEAYWKRYGTKLEDLGVWYGPETLGIAVPKYVKAKTIADLKAQAGQYGNQIVGIEPGAGEMRLVKTKVMPAYGMGGMKLVQSSTPAMLAQLKKSIAAKKPVAVTLWHPHWAYSKFPIRDLKDPKGAWGVADQIHTTARKGFAKDHPEVAGWFKKFKMTDAQLSKLESDIQDAGPGKEAQGTQTWMDDNKDFVQKMTS